MEYTVNYPKGGSNKMWEPMHINALISQIKHLTIQGQTHTRDGCKVLLMDENNWEVGRYVEYSNLGVPINCGLITKKVCDDINLILSLTDESIPVVSTEDLLPIIKEVVAKCESRYGRRLPDSDYEVLVVFN